MADNSLDSPRFWVITPAAGKGRRLLSDVAKQFVKLNGQSIAQHCLSKILQVPNLERVIVPCDTKDKSWHDVRAIGDARVDLTDGGEERADSVLKALHLLSESLKATDWVIVHDIVRPCITLKSILNLIEAVKDHPVGGILAAPVNDTVKVISSDGLILRTAERDAFRLAQTPQIFRFGELFGAMQAACNRGLSLTDEASAMERLGRPVLFVEGRHDNIKITHPEDLPIAAAILSAQDGAP